VAPALTAVAQVGNTYTASLYFALAATLEQEGRVLGGRRLGLFSYGSGCCAEFFTGVVPAAAATLGSTGVREALGRRTLIDVPTYERLLQEGERGGDPPAGFAGDFVFRGIDNDRRVYERAREMLAA
jgi:hydroxymethylglutaryl-CoA synthase